MKNIVSKVGARGVVAIRLRNCLRYPVNVCLHIQCRSKGCVVCENNMMNPG